jgi:hypothetical protein
MQLFFFIAKRSISIGFERSKRTIAKICWYYLRERACFELGKKGRKTNKKYFYFISKYHQEKETLF